jgi:hypothetical protein
VSKHDAKVKIPGFQYHVWNYRKLLAGIKASKEHLSSLEKKVKGLSRFTSNIVWTFFLENKIKACKYFAKSCFTINVKNRRV